jgi:hypothetical protein
MSVTAVTQLTLRYLKQLTIAPLGALRRGWLGLGSEPSGQYRLPTRFDTDPLQTQLAGLVEHDRAVGRQDFGLGGNGESVPRSPPRRCLILFARRTERLRGSSLSLACARR